MPKIISYTPSWLSRPSPGFQCFSSADQSPTPASGGSNGYHRSINGTARSEKYYGPNRILAHRGTEIFVVVDNTIRWSDLCMLKDEQEDREQGVGSNGRSRQATDYEPSSNSYRVLKVPVTEKIRQLIPSPNGTLLAILTSHTVHVAILPDSVHLSQADVGPLRLKTHTIGPTAHVLSQSPIASALWHPLGVAKECLVTVTTEAVVRVWELNQQNRWTFDRSTLEIDLKKLARGTSSQDDFGATGIGRNRGFSLDALDMEVAAASFGSTGSGTESDWSPFTLWIAMKEGDVYALCPLLPTKWQPSTSLLSTLAPAVVAKAASMEDGMMAEEERRKFADQYQWMTDIDKQEPTLMKGVTDLSPLTQIYDRPSFPGPIPRLQGPFRIAPDDAEDDLELSDVYVIAPNADDIEVAGSEEDETDSETLYQESSSIPIVCLVTTSGRVLICLDIIGVEAQWLPAKKSKIIGTLPESVQPELLVLEALDTLKASEVQEFEWPTFSADVQSRHSFFVTHGKGVYFFSLDPWLPNLEREIQNSSNAGTEFRLDVLMKGPGTLREKIISLDNFDETDADRSLAASLILQDSDLGYFMLTATPKRPLAVTFDAPASIALEINSGPLEYDYQPAGTQLAIGPARSAYAPPDLFWTTSSLSKSLDERIQGRYKKVLKEEIRLSPATLDVMTEAHRVLSQETHQLGLAVADLFRRSERLQDELRDQIRRANETATRIESITDEDTDDYDTENAKGSTRIEQRLEAVKAKQAEITARHDALRRKLAKSGGRDLSEKEQTWIAEVDTLKRSLLEPDRESQESDSDESHAAELWQRFAEAKELVNDLITHTKELAEKSDSDRSGAFKVPQDIRKTKVAQVNTLLGRESALLEAAQLKLDRLSLA